MSRQGVPVYRPGGKRALVFLRSCKMWVSTTGALLNMGATTGESDLVGPEWGPRIWTFNKLHQWF